MDKEKMRRRLKENIARGKAGERQAVDSDAIWEGQSSKRTGKGSDFKQERTNILTGKKESRKIEVKTGNARLSKLQKKHKPVVRRINPWPPY